jgi:hypothetical protein
MEQVRWATVGFSRPLGSGFCLDCLLSSGLFLCKKMIQSAGSEGEARAVGSTAACLGSEQKSHPAQLVSWALLGLGNMKSLLPDPKSNFPSVSQNVCHPPDAQGRLASYCELLSTEY